MFDRASHFDSGLRGALCGLLALSLLACEDDPKRGGGLVVRVESDLALPKDLDVLRLEVTRKGKTLLARERDLFDPQSRDLEFRIAADGDATPVQVRGIGYQRSEVRVERRAITPVPRSQQLLLRLPLRYLCSGKVGEDACGPDETCDQGQCVSAIVRSESLPPYEIATDELAQSMPDASAATCLNVAECFAGATLTKIDPDACSFQLAGEEATSTSLNVGLRLPRGGSGACGSEACWIALDAGGDGWMIVEDSVQLPAGACREAARFEVVYSTACPTKTESQAVCWEPGRSESPSTGETPTPLVAASVPPAIGTACEPPGAIDCGMCGTRMRVCSGGVWSEWGECIGRGVCEPDMLVGCENYGTRVCRGDCQWGDCEGQRCDGPDTQQCGYCGTKRRTCQNGEWSEWSECQGQGRCNPNAVELCESNGLQVCGGKCQWETCVDQVCPGPPAQACERCGTQRRACDPATGVFAAWGACEDQGECTANETKPCEQSGHYTCMGNCMWDSVCRDRICEGAASRSCERCGTQTRTCNTDTGEWSDWGGCDDQRACEPNQTRSCGMRGLETCNASCQWSNECTGQVCAGENTQQCERCGTQTRDCDPGSGTWGGWSSCTNMGACNQGERGTCGSDGAHVCGDDCRWGPCTEQSCREPLEEDCERCGKRTRTCDPNTGKVSAWSACTNQGVCAAGDSGSCGNGNSGTHTCTRECQWPPECHNQQCSEPATRPCDRCGMQRSTCNGETGIASWSACLEQGDCSSGQTRSCGVTGTQRCSDMCGWGDCDCGGGSMSCGDRCADVQTDESHCGSCGNACKMGETCSAGKCIIECTPSQTRCSDTECYDLSSDDAHCGSCTNRCGDGFSCQAGECKCKPPTSLCSGACVDLTSDLNHCGTCTNSCRSPGSEVGEAVCTNGTCDVVCFDLRASEGPKYTACDRQCVDTDWDEMNCGMCGKRCPAEIECVGGQCETPTAGTGGGGAGGAGAGGAGAGGAGAGGAGAGGAGSGGAGTGGAGAGGAGSSGAGAGGAGAGGAGAGGAGAGGAGAGGAGAGGAGSGGAGAGGAGAGGTDGSGSDDPAPGAEGVSASDAAGTDGSSSSVIR